MKGIWLKRTAVFVVFALVLSIGFALVWQGMAKPAEIEGGQASDYGQIYEVFRRRRLEQMKNLDGGFRVDSVTGAVPEAGFGGNMTEAAADTALPEFSATNVQETGVDEADVVKTDGQYLYVLYENSIKIISANGANMSEVAVLKPQNENERYTSLYLWEKKLVAIKEHADSVADPRILADKVSSSGGFTGVDIYDLENCKVPALLGGYSQDGYYVNSRMVDGYLYLITQKYDVRDPDPDKPGTFIPSVIENGETKLLAAADVMINPDADSRNCPEGYLVVSGLSIEKGGEKSSVRALLGYDGTVYASRKNLYVAGYADMGDKTRYTSGTQLLRFGLKAGKVTFGAEGKVEGTVDGQFSMSEKGDTFRLVTTVDSYSYIEEDVRYSGGTDDARTNRLYVLGLDLAEKGAVKDLAPGERIYSCRFIGDMAYFVTFRNIDPLFAVDLTNPAKPEVLSKLKIPGFSEYLHPYGEGKLLGLGRDADEETGQAGNVKLSMFDISNPRDVTEADKLVTEENYSEALYDHKAILANPEKNIIAFPGDGNYLIYSYKQGEGFVLNKAVKFNAQSFEWYGAIRGQYIGDYLYVTGLNGVAALDMRAYEIAEIFVYD